MSKTISPEDWFSLTHAEQECMFKSHAESLPSNEIDKDYIFMSNIYGHEIEGPYAEGEEKDVEKLEKLYDDAVIHDCGWAVRSVYTNQIGFLAREEANEGFELTKEDTQAFFEKHGCTLQFVPDWPCYSGTHPLVLCYVPMHRIDNVREIMDAMYDIANAPSPSISM
ncbi:hypothetical protein [Mesorhizobium sp. SP-1A]|uniref:hypothetical protein n=1 Tax=Mesorhizobium sp. SP-1A TaxID=3077840 RepID=UPI0028F6CEC2|nr:hypothetical protein [Mesorhizobium sp. SP-1A]